MKARLLNTKIMIRLFLRAQFLNQWRWRNVFIFQFLRISNQNLQFCFRSKCAAGRRVMKRYKRVTQRDAANFEWNYLHANFLCAASILRDLIFCFCNFIVEKERMENCRSRMIFRKFKLSQIQIVSRQMNIHFRFQGDDKTKIIIQRRHRQERP